jgi:hypothetical protein
VTAIELARMVRDVKEILEDRPAMPASGEDDRGRPA